MTAELDALSDVDGYWYLASPYSKYHAGPAAAFVHVSRVAGALLQRRIPVFCPIAHSHPVSTHSDIPHDDHELWMWADGPLMAGAHGLMVVLMLGWRESVGVTEEIRRFRKWGKPVVWLAPSAIGVGIPEDTEV